MTMFFKKQEAFEQFDSTDVKVKKLLFTICSLRTTGLVYEFANSRKAPNFLIKEETAFEKKNPEGFEYFRQSENFWFESGERFFKTLSKIEEKIFLGTFKEKSCKNKMK